MCIVHSGAEVSCSKVRWTKKRATNYVRCERRRIVTLIRKSHVGFFFSGPCRSRLHLLLQERRDYKILAALITFIILCFDMGSPCSCSALFRSASINLVSVYQFHFQFLIFEIFQFKFSFNFLCTDCLAWGADLHMAQPMPLPHNVSCFSKIQIGFTFLIPAHPGNPGQRVVKRVLLLH